MMISMIGQKGKFVLPFLSFSGVFFEIEVNIGK